MGSECLAVGADFKIPNVGLPKEIVWPHGFFAAVDFLRDFPVPTGRINALPWLIDPANPLLMKTSLCHSAGTVLWAACIFHGTHFVVCPDIPMTPVVLESILSDIGATTGLFLPDTLADLASSSEGLKALSGLKSTVYVGMPMPTAVGDMISQVTRLYSSFGLTEKSYIPTLQPKEPSDWEYLEWNLYHLVEMRQQDAEHHQLIVPRSPRRYTQRVFHVLPSISEFCTGDLFIRHSTDAKLWKHVGREDDMSKLQNRILLYPRPIELTLENHQFVDKAVVTTNNALSAVLIVEPRWEQVEHLRLPEGVIESIWPLVEKVNADLPSEAEISRRNILLVAKDRPFQTTAKGTMKRPSVVQGYAGDIEILEGLKDGQLKLPIKL